MSIVLISLQAVGKIADSLRGFNSKNSILTGRRSIILFTALYLCFSSFSIVHEQTAVAGGGYRTAKYTDWVNSVDVKGKRAAVKRKNDKVFFKLTLSVASASNILLLDFGMPATGAITRGVAKTETLATFNGKKLVDTLTTVVADDIIQIDGIGWMGKKMKLKYQWGKAKPVTLKEDSDYLLNRVGLPMPTLHNVGEELFPKGFGQGTAYFANGLLIGVPQGDKGGNSVLHKKYADVLSSLVKKVKNGDLLHTGDARCLDSLGKKLFDKQQSKLPPDKFNNKLFAEALMLKLNIAASATQKFPVGFGEQLYFNGSSVFHLKLVSEISAYADTIISCLTPTTIGAVTYADLYASLSFINGLNSATPYTIDTLSFASKTVLAGFTLNDASEYLQPKPGVKPKIFTANEQFGQAVPEQFTLMQNYPNPFNPKTNFGFRINNFSSEGGSASGGGLVTLRVYNMLGQEITTLIDREEYESGEYEVVFDASLLSSGVYLYKITVESVDEKGLNKTFTDVKRMTLVK